jgi:hypothetical protein
MGLDTSLWRRPRSTAAQAYHARAKAPPTNDPSQHFRIRHDTVDQSGKLTLRYGSRIQHLDVGKTHDPVLSVATTTTVTVISKRTHQFISSHTRRPTPQLLAQPTKKSRPMAGVLRNR